MRNYFELNEVSIFYNIYTKVSDRSLKNSIISSIGGKFVNKKKHNYINALKNITLNIKKGDRIGLIGPNGSGKSTFLRLLSGCLEPTSGKIIRNGKINSILNLSMGLDLELTGYENIKLYSEIQNFDRIRKKKFVNEVVKFSELNNFLNMTVETYSDGMRLRLAFAMATAETPDVLLLDEIVNVGDAKFSEKANQRIKELVNLSKVMVLATHNKDTIKKYCNKCIIFKNGEVEVIKMIDLQMS